jgi:hypothetical protein
MSRQGGGGRGKTLEKVLNMQQKWANTQNFDFRLRRVLDLY